MKVSHHITALAATLAALALAPACSDEEIVLARLPPRSEVGTSGEGQRCVDGADCAGSSYCARSSCGDVAGTCEARPVVCEEDAKPVCGCDGVTYWNDCLRRAAGMTSARAGECGVSGRECGRRMKGGPAPGSPDGAQGCPPGVVCARLLPPEVDTTLPGSCPPDLSGTCWALPVVCPDRGGIDRWVDCDPFHTSCVSTCDAIKSGLPHKRATACP